MHALLAHFRRPTALVALAGALLLLMPATAAIAGADTITVHERGVDVNPGSQNPCTGAMGTVVDVYDIHFHVTTLTDGTINETGHNTATVFFTPDDPSQPSYEGHETYASADSGNGNRFVTTTTFHVRMKGTYGSFLDLREVGHLTVTQNGVSASFDRPTMTGSS